LLERVTHWKCIEKIFSRLQLAFCVLLIAFISYVTFFDIMRLLPDQRRTFEERRFERLLIDHGGEEK
jgi:hypothetical protein